MHDSPLLPLKILINDPAELYQQFIRGTGLDEIPGYQNDLEVDDSNEERLKHLRKFSRVIEGYGIRHFQQKYEDFIPERLTEISREAIRRIGEELTTLPTHVDKLNTTYQYLGWVKTLQAQLDLPLSIAPANVEFDQLQKHLSSVIEFLQSTLKDLKRKKPKSTHHMSIPNSYMLASGVSLENIPAVLEMLKNEELVDEDSTTKIQLDKLLTNKKVIPRILWTSSKDQLRWFIRCLFDQHKVTNDWEYENRKWKIGDQCFIVKEHPDYKLSSYTGAPPPYSNKDIILRIVNKI